MLVVALATACSSLPEYHWPNPVTVGQTADGFIKFLKKDRFPNGELDNFPQYAIILYDHRPETVLEAAGYQPSDYQRFNIGYTMPNYMYLVEAKADTPAFVVNIGTPGAGGVSTQAAELAALGATHIVHMGTCLVLGNEDLPGRPFVSHGSYKDGAAVLVSEAGTAKDRIALPDKALAEVLMSEVPSGRSGIGYTVPTIYYQPQPLIEHLLNEGSIGDNPKVDYIEMEQAPFFTICRRAGVNGASVVLASDSVEFVDGRLFRRFSDADAQRENWTNLFKSVLRAFAHQSGQ